MRIAVAFTDRVGLAQEILAVVARRDLGVSAVEVEPPQVFLEVPALGDGALGSLRRDLMAVPGVDAVEVISILPGARRRLYLNALLAALADPVIAVDADGRVAIANAAAVAASGLPEGDLAGLPLEALTGDPGLAAALRANGYRLPATEVEVGGSPYLLESVALHEPGGAMAGAVLTLHAPKRIGERLSALQNYAAGGFDAILGASTAIRALKQRAARMAQVDAPLLIRGETGTGKELVAHACHAGSRRAGQPFFALNCAALPESLAESELFGYAPGAFTGALKAGRPGLLELADRGTLFLDEVGEMSAYLQAKLLRFLNDGSFRRVGGDRDLRADVRIVSATHRDLDRMVEEGGFRQDLLFRLDVLRLEVPPLRERREDILPLARVFIERACAQTGRRSAQLTAAAREALLAAPWTGNVRQLQNVVFRAVTLGDGPLIDAGELDLPAGEVRPAVDPAAVDSLDAAVGRFEKALLERLYPDYPSSRKLAERLGTSHSAIAARLRRYGIGQPRA